MPDYIPSVGEVDAFLKMAKPDGAKEDLGISILDEPALNHSDPTVLEMKYIQCKKTTTTAPIEVRSIECADKKPKEITKWVTNITDLHKTKPPPTVQYTKQMPDVEVLMQEWPRDMEEGLKDTQFPGPEIDLHCADYSKLICTMLDIPVHTTANNKSIVEGLHVLFTLYSEFKQNVHLNRNQNEDGGVGADIA